MDYVHLKKTLEQMTEREVKYAGEHFPTSQVYKKLGLTRDALRYYEELGILMPNKNLENSYREYTINDVWNILAIDFYKKRGVTPLELKKAKEGNGEENHKELLGIKKTELEEELKLRQQMLKNLEETLDFLETTEKELNLFQIREFPLYEVREELSSIINFNEYGDKLLEYMDMSQEDIFSNMVKVLLVDDNGYTGAKGYFVKRTGRRRKGREYLEGGQALYVIIKNETSEGDDIMEKMFIACMEWAEEHDRKFKGMVYLKPIYAYLSGESIGTYLECWVPLQN